MVFEGVPDFDMVLRKGLATCAHVGKASERGDAGDGAPALYSMVLCRDTRCGRGVYEGLI